MRFVFQCESLVSGLIRGAKHNVQKDAV